MTATARPSSPSGSGSGPALHTTAATGSSRLACNEVRGGNHTTRELVELPGLHGMLYSNPCTGAMSSGEGR